MGVGGDAGDAGRRNIRVGLDLPEQTDLSVYLDILSLKLLCGQFSLDVKYSKTRHPLQQSVSFLLFFLLPKIAY